MNKSLKVTVEQLEDGVVVDTNVITTRAVFMSYITKAEEVGEYVDIDPEVEPNEEGEQIIGGLVGTLNLEDLHDMFMQMLAVVGSINEEFFGELVDELIEIRMEGIQDQVKETIAFKLRGEAEEESITHHLESNDS